ncbi:MAG: YqgE/AlgH family protein, partial [Actinomycetota bacterium]
TNALECAALRLFVGYSGWGPAQLDGEIAGGAWFVVDAHADDPFDAEPSSLCVACWNATPPIANGYAASPMTTR